MTPQYRPDALVQLTSPGQSSLPTLRSRVAASRAPSPSETSMNDPPPLADEPSPPSPPSSWPGTTGKVASPPPQPPIPSAAPAQTNASHTRRHRVRLNMSFSPRSQN